MSSHQNELPYVSKTEYMKRLGAQTGIYAAAWKFWTWASPFAIAWVVWMTHTLVRLEERTDRRTEIFVSLQQEVADMRRELIDLRITVARQTRQGGTAPRQPPQN